MEFGFISGHLLNSHVWHKARSMEYSAWIELACNGELVSLTVIPLKATTSGLISEQ